MIEGGGEYRAEKDLSASLAMTKQFDIDLKKRVNVFSIVLASFGVAKDTIVAFENLFCLIKKKKKKW